MRNCIGISFGMDHFVESISNLKHLRFLELSSDEGLNMLPESIGDLGFGQAAMLIDKEILAEAVVCCLLYVKTESFAGNGLVLDASSSFNLFRSHIQLHLIKFICDLRMVGIMVALARSFGDIDGGLAIVHCSWFEGGRMNAELETKSVKHITRKRFSPDISKLKVRSDKPSIQLSMCISSITHSMNDNDNDGGGDDMWMYKSRLSIGGSDGDADEELSDDKESKGFFGVSSESDKEAGFYSLSGKPPRRRIGRGCVDQVIGVRVW
ncbi:hypothetical protein HHK36_032236 [Tetracentron sinense]|uniref:Uncharacterized protein n=1 Tax=Tetracentron sinense TaxID=13715 RepID=A0A834Y9G2_TETSI|nr:hypothetical protein HHK36_032236 [Tetracentron sinense]